MFRLFLTQTPSPHNFVQKKQVKIFHRCRFLYLCTVQRVSNANGIRANWIGLDLVGVLLPASRVWTGLDSVGRYAPLVGNCCW